jgi:acyl-coenzyme A thioesterase PaaI-like protein
MKASDLQHSKQGPTDYFGLNIPFLDHLGVVPEFAEGGKSRISVQLKPEYENSFQVAHGGLIMTLLDCDGRRSSQQHESCLRRYYC